MRLWSIHPRYLDPVGLVALWREALLAKRVLQGRTRGYRHHPQLERFHAARSPLSAINAYLGVVWREAQRRGYAFDRRKLGRVTCRVRLGVTDGQLAYERRHLRKKLVERNPTFAKELAVSRKLAPHPIFRVRQGPVAAWERI